MAETRLDLPAKVLVAGAAGGIGMAVAKRLSDSGAAVIGTDRSAPPAGLRPEQWIEADVASPSGRGAIVAACAKGGIGGFVYAAGILDASQWQSITENEAAHLLSVNLVAPFFLTRSLLPHFQPAASIVLIGSIAGLRASPLTPFYAASKAALRNLGASLALSLQPHAVRVNVVAPGLIDTPLTDGLNREIARQRGATLEDIAAERAAAIPLGRAGTPNEVADACMFLLSRQSAYVTGTTLHATGGVMAGSI